MKRIDVAFIQGTAMGIAVMLAAAILPVTPAMAKPPKVVVAQIRSGDVIQEVTDAVRLGGRRATLRTGQEVEPGTCIELLKGHVALSLRINRSIFTYQRGNPGDCQKVAKVGEGGEGCLGVYIGSDDPNRLQVFQRCGDSFIEVDPDDRRSWNPLAPFDNIMKTISFSGTRLGIFVGKRSTTVSVSEGKVEIGEPGDPLHRIIQAGRQFTKYVNGQGREVDETRDTQIKIERNVTLVESKVVETSTRSTTLNVLGDGVLHQISTQSTTTTETVEVHRVTEGSQAEIDQRVSGLRQQGQSVLLSDDLLHADLGALGKLGTPAMLRDLFENMLANPETRGAARARVLFMLAHYTLEAGGQGEPEPVSTPQARQERALTLLQEARSLEPEPQVLAWVLQALRDLFETWMPRPRNREAEEVFKELVAVRERLAGRALDRAEILRWNEERDAAAEAFGIALAYYEDQGDRRRAAQCWAGIGEARKTAGQLDAAEEAFRKALEWIPESSGEGGGWGEGEGEIARRALLGLGDVLSLRGRYQDAIVHYTRGEATLRDAGDAEGLWTRSLFLYQRGNAYAALGDKAQALADYLADRSVSRRLVEIDKDDARARAGLMVTCLRLARFWAETGSAEEAIGSYDETAELLDRLLEDNPSSRRWRLLRAGVDSSRGQLLLNVGRTADGIALTEASTRALERMVAEDPSDTELVRELISGILTVGETLRDAGRAGDAQAQFERAIELGERLVELENTEDENLYSLLLGYERLGMLHAGRGEHAPAVVAHEREKVVAKELAQRNPGSPRFARSLGIALVKLAESLGQVGRIDDAIANYREARTLFEGLEGAEVAHRCSVCLSGVYVELGSLFDKQGDIDAAREALGAHLRFREAGESPDAPVDVQYGMLVALERIGDLDVRLGALKGARGLFEREVRIAERLVQMEPKVARWHRSLGIAYGRLARVLLDLGMSDLAADVIARSEAAVGFGLEQLGREDPYATVRSELLRWLAMTLGKAGRFDDAYGLLRKAGDLVAACPASPDRWENLYQVSETATNLGDTQYEAGAYDSARAFLAFSISIQEACVRESPMRSDWRHGLIISLERMGLTEQGDGNEAKALEFYLRQRELAQSLRRDFPDEPRWIKSDRIAIGKVASVLGNLKRRDEVLAVVAKGLEVLETEGLNAPGATPGDRMTYTAILTELGDALRESEQWKAADQLYERSIVVMSALLAEEPSNLERKYSLLVSVERRGMTALELKDPQSALAFFETEYRLAEELVAAEPDNPRWKRSRRITTSKMAEVLTVLGRHEEAAQWTRRWLDLLGDEFGERPEPATRQRLVSALIDAGDMLVQTWRYEEARPVFQRALELAEMNVSESPRDSERLYGLMLAVERLGNVDLARGDRTGALAWFQRQDGITRDLVSIKPERQSYLRARRITAGKIASVYASMMMPDEVVAWVRQYQECLEREGLDRPEATPNDGLSYVRAILWVGDLLKQVQRFEEARDFASRALAVLEGVPDDGAELTERAELLATALELAGSVEWEMGDAERALPHFQRRFEVFKALAAQQPDYRGWQMGISSSMAWLGKTLVQSGRCSEALDVGAMRIEHLEHLRRNDESDASIEEVLAGAHMEAGHWHRACGQLDQAQEHYQTTKRIYLKYAKEHPTDFYADTYQALGHFAVGEVLEQHAVLRRMFEADPVRASVTEDLVECEVLSGAYARASEQLPVALERNREPSWTRVVLLAYGAIAAAMSGDGAEGARLAREAARLARTLRGHLGWTFAGAIPRIQNLDHPLAEPVRDLIGWLDKGSFRVVPEEIAAAFDRFAAAVSR